MKPAEPVVLHGSAFARGRAQAAACPDAAAVRAMVTARLDATAPLLAQPHVARFLDAQWDFANTHDPQGLAELFGLAEGYGLDPRRLFAFLHAGQLSGLPDDGCTAWAYGRPGEGTMVVKNRDLRGPALSLQRVFRHGDPDWNGRTILCIGSLGAPGAYSSGINSDGLALADTQVVTTDQGVGMLRYFTMTRLLRTCSTVDQALEELRGMRHAGGGTLILGDATGAMAAVEIGHSHLPVEHRQSAWVARTNHFLSPPLADRLAARPGDPGIDDSHGRLAALSAWLAALPGAPSASQAAAVMATHDAPGAAGLCRHGGEDGSSTVSCAIFACHAGTLYFVHGNPCHGEWAELACVERAEDGLRDGAGR